jgi:hypothetical protein
VAAVLIVGLAALLGIGGCGTGSESEVTTTAAGAVTTVAFTETTAAPMAADRDEGTAASMAADRDQGMPPGAEGPVAYDQAAGGDGGSSQSTGSLIALQGTSGQKVISGAQMEIEVESGKFETAFDQALLLADRYGGYIVSSGAHAGGDDGGMKSGTIAIRVPATAFAKALADAGKLGEVKNQQIQTQDVTEEYVDLEARIANSEAHVQALLALLAKAKTVDEVLQVQQVLTGAQQQLEELKGRLRYLDEHTSFSTLALSIYESGAIIAATTEWGFTGALKDAVRNLVGAINAIIRGLGVLVPVLIVLAIIAYVAYRVWVAAARRRREGEARNYQPYPQGGRGTATTGAPMTQATAQTPTAAPTPAAAQVPTTAPAPTAPAESEVGAATPPADAGPAAVGGADRA